MWGAIRNSVIKITNSPTALDNPMSNTSKAFPVLLVLTLNVAFISSATSAQLLPPVDPVASQSSTQFHSPQTEEKDIDPNEAFDRAVEILYQGGASEQEVGHALELLETSARRGHSFAQAELGYRYLTGNQVTADYNEALFWLSAAAHQGHPHAMGFLGNMFATGTGVERNEDFALRFVRRGVELGDAKSLDMMGRRMLHGPEAERDFAKGVELLTAAADRGFPPSAFTVGLYYLFGEYMEADNVLSVRYLEKAARFGHPLAPFVVSQLQKNGLEVESPLEDLLAAQSEMIEQMSPQQRNAVAWWMAVKAGTPLSDGRLAVEIMESTLADPSNRTPAYLDTLAAAYAAVEDFTQAVTTQRQAIAAFPPEQRQNISSDFAERLALYQSNRAYTE